nr:MAG TPA: hypothetical protein [Crassvirales sp.]
MISPIKECRYCILPTVLFEYKLTIYLTIRVYNRNTSFTREQQKALLPVSRLTIGQGIKP